MKVIHILYRATVGGSERAAYNLIKKQLNNNYQVICIILKSGGGFFKKFELLLKNNLLVFKVNRFLNMINFYRFLKNKEQDWIIHSHVRNLKLGFVLRHVSNPKLLTEHLLTQKLRGISPKNYRKLKLYYRLYQRDYRYITSVSGAVKQALVEDFGIDSNKIKVIFNGVQASYPQKIKKNGFFNIGNATHFEKIKNIDLFLSIADELIQLDRSFKFALIGDGSQKSKVLSFIKERDLDDNILVLEQQEELSSFFNQLNLGLITSYSETFSLFAAECLVRGIPVVAPNIGGLKEVVADNESGYLIKSFNKQEFIEKILKLKNNQNIYQTFSKKAYDQSQKFSIDNIYQQYHQLYCEIVGQENDLVNNFIKMMPKK